MQIAEIPILNEFDCFYIYENQEMMDVSSYIVEARQFDMFCNKRYSLCYGRFLKYLKNINILANKGPRFIKRVGYNEIIDELYDTQISNNSEEYVYLKKPRVVGLLEKRIKKALKGFLSDSLSEARDNE